MFPRLQNRVFYIDFCVRSHGKNCLSLKLWKKTVYTELGTRQLYSFATTTLRLRNLQCLKDQKNIQVSMSRWSSCNNQQLCGLKTWSRCGDSTYYRVPSSVYVSARLLFSHGHSFTTRLNRVNNESPYFVAPTWSITGSPGRKRRRQTYIQYSNLHTTYRMNSYILSVKKKIQRCIHGLVCYALGLVSRDA